VKDAYGNSVAAPAPTLSAFSDPQCHSPAPGVLLFKWSVQGDTITFSDLSYMAFGGGAIYLGASVAGASTACSNAVTLVGLASTTVPHTCIMSGTLEPASGATLDCQGQTLVPTALGTAPVSASALPPPSVPETAVFFHGVQGATVQNCSLQGFDYGFILFGSNDNRILSNTVSVRGMGAYLIDSNRNQITGNSITWSVTPGKGVLLDSLTDSNIVSGNTLIESGAAGSFNLRLSVPSFPGGTVVRDVGIFVIGFYLNMATAYSNGALYQFNALADPRVTGAQSASNNTVAGNTMLGSIRVSGGSRDNAVSGNTIRGNSTAPGIIETSASAVSTPFPGQCAQAASRLCFADTDCAIQGFDAASKGPCEVNPPNVFLVGGSWDNQLIGNFIIGPLSTGISSVGHNSVIESNTISGGTIATGISWAGSKTIQHNQVNATLAMNITINTNAGPYDPALTNVSLNDFTGYRTAVQIPAGWTVTPTLFSSGGRGNYWGLTCTMSGGFDPSKVSGAPASFVVKDDHPFGVAVAGTSLDLLPATCE
jgi:parallel beta-helix repeat protein